MTKRKGIKKTFLRHLKGLVDRRLQGEIDLQPRPLARKARQFTFRGEMFY